METKGEENVVNEPFSANRTYSYADYLTWDTDYMVELIKGKVFKQAAAAPRRINQEIAALTITRLTNRLKGKRCKAYIAPFDVRLPVNSSMNEDIFTVVQPDICVVCDPFKLDEMGCVGARDLIMEIMSPGSNSKELKTSTRSMRKAGSANIGSSILRKKRC